MDEILNLKPNDDAGKLLNNLTGEGLLIDLKDNLMMATWILKELEELDKKLGQY
ncbi:MAG: hypothetical protein WBB93_08060 [Saprospiraceae bacterium]